MKSLQKKALVFVLALTLLVGGLVGCGPQSAAIGMPVTPIYLEDDGQETSRLGEVQNTDPAEGERQPGMVRGKVLLDNGEMVAVGIIIENEEGARWRATSTSLAGYNLRLQPGRYTLTFTRGTEYSTVVKEVEVESYKVYYQQDVRLVQLYDAYAEGWIAGDLHMHTHYSDGADSAEEVLYSNISNGLYFGFLTDHNSARGLAEWQQGSRVVANIDSEGNARMFNAFEGVEVTTEFGHYQSLGAGLTFDNYEVMLRDIERSKSGEELDEIIKEKIIYIAETIRREGGVPQINHPFSSNTMGFSYWEVAHYFDTIEIWNGVFVPGDGRYESDNPAEIEQNYRSKMKWYELLNEVKEGGKYYAATGGTDNHEVAAAYTPSMQVGEVITTMAEYKEVYKRSGLYSGVPTTYVYCPEEVTQENILAALAAGNSFITNGIIVLADVDGVSYGGTAELGGEDVALNIDAFCREGFEGIHVIRNGEVFLEIPLSADVSSYTETVMLQNIQPGDWIVLEVYGVEAYYAITNPIFFA